VGSLTPHNPIGLHGLLQEIALLFSYLTEVIFQYVLLLKELISIKQYAIKMYEGVELMAPPFMTSGLDESGQLHAPAALPLVRSGQ
jgi:hypothetical protein